MNIKIAVASGKGGTGKTFVSTNLFYALQQKGEKCALVDCDAEEPNAMIFFTSTNSEIREVKQKVPVIDTEKCTYCSLCHDYCAYNAIFIIPPSKVIRVFEDLCHDCGACYWACKFDAITEKNVVLGTVTSYNLTDISSIIEARTRVGVYSPVPLIQKAIAKTDKEGIIIMDAPPGTSCPFIQTVYNADYVVLVTEPTPFGLSDLKQSVDTIRGMGKPFGVVVNRAGTGDNKVYDYLENENINLLSEIGFDRNIAVTYSKGHILSAMESEWEKEFIKLYNKIIIDFKSLPEEKIQ